MADQEVSLVYGYTALKPQMACRFTPETRRERLVRFAYQACAAVIEIALRMGLILSVALLARWVIHG